MHTISMKIGDLEIAVHFNSDWSGHALINIGDQNLSMPAELFVRVAKVINERACFPPDAGQRQHPVRQCIAGKCRTPHLCNLGDGKCVLHRVPAGRGDACPTGGKGSRLPRGNHIPD